MATHSSVLAWRIPGTWWAMNLAKSQTRLKQLSSRKIAADGDCSHEAKRCLLLGIKALTNLGSIFKSRDITLPTKVHIVKIVIFPEVIHANDSWAIKKAEH